MSREDEEAFEAAGAAEHADAKAKRKGREERWESSGAGGRVLKSRVMPRVMFGATEHSTDVVEWRSLY